MQLQLKPSPSNQYPLRGILIKGKSIQAWSKELDRMQLALNRVEVYPLPNTTANSLWGCLVVFSGERRDLDIGQHTWCQCMDKLLFFPVYSTIFPKMRAEELAHLLLSKKYFFHPTIGMVPLDKPIDWADLLVVKANRSLIFQTPAEAIWIPQGLKSFQIEALPPEEVLREMEKQMGERQAFTDKPLSTSEKARLFFLERLYQKEKDGSSSTATPLMQSVQKLFGSKEQSWSEELKKEYEALKQRNEKNVDKLLDLLKKDPEEGMKYAIPLDDNGSSRGGTQDIGQGRFDFNMRWLDFSLFGNNQSWGTGSGTGGGTLDIGDKYISLRAQYYQSAQELERQGKHEKAAFIYMKLLKDYQAAARALEEGKKYEKAAAIYLKMLKNKAKAADCYEKGKLYAQAIELFIELKRYEKTGDLYLQLNQKDKAFEYYDLLIEEKISNLQYFEAATLSKEKKDDVAASQKFLKEGWFEGKHPAKCLSQYYNNIDDNEEILNEIQEIYYGQLAAKKRESFLHIIYKQMNRHYKLEEPIKHIAYHLIATEAKTNPSFVSKIRLFNKEDSRILKDILRFRTNKKRNAKGITSLLSRLPKRNK